MAPVEHWLFGKRRVWLYTIYAQRVSGQISGVEGIIRAEDVEVWRLRLEPGKNGDDITIHLQLRGGRPEATARIAEQLQQLSGVHAISYWGSHALASGSETNDAIEEMNE